VRRRRSLAYPKPCSIEWWDTRSTYCNPVNLQNTIGEGFVFLLQVTSLLWEFLWLSVGQDSHFPIQPVLHVIHIHDSSIPPRRLDTYTPSALLRLTGFMGSPSITDTDLDYWGPTCWLRPPFMSEIESVTLVSNQSECGVMGHTPLSLCPPSGRTVMCRGFRCTWVRSDSCTSEWPKFGPTTIPNSCGHDTGGGLCVRRVGRMTTVLLHGLRVQQGLSLLWINKAKDKDKMYMSVGVMKD
jgi:hypothetical protein